MANLAEIYDPVMRAKDIQVGMQFLVMKSYLNGIEGINSGDVVKVTEFVEQDEHENCGTCIKTNSCPCGRRAMYLQNKYSQTCVSCYVSLVTLDGMKVVE